MRRLSGLKRSPWPLMCNQNHVLRVSVITPYGFLGLCLEFVIDVIDSSCVCLDRKGFGLDRMKGDGIITETRMTSCCPGACHGLRRTPKLNALKKQGAVNPNPDRVRDPLFGADEFFDARDLVQVRYEMLRRVEVEGHAVTQACQAFGFSRPVFYKTRDAFAREGLPGLVPKRRGPRGGHKLTAEVMKGIEEALAEDRSLGAEALVERVEERYGVRVHVRSLQRALARQKKKPQ